MRTPDLGIEVTEPSDGEQEWGREQIGHALQCLRERLEDERRRQFAPFDVPADCYWPAARVYHEHSSMGPAWTGRLTNDEVSVLTLDRNYKRYPNAHRMALPASKPLAADLEGTIRSRESRRAFAPEAISLAAVTQLLELGCGITQQRDVPRRAAPSPGGLYPVETYPVAFSVEGIGPGVYHYAVLDHALETVRSLSTFEVTREFLPPDLFAARPALVIALSVIFPRVQVKYLERGYRFALLEAGHIAQNILLAATALGLNAVPVGGFWDEPFNELLGFDTSTEAVLYCILLGNPA